MDRLQFRRRSIPVRVMPSSVGDSETVLCARIDERPDLPSPQTGNP